MQSVLRTLWVIPQAAFITLLSLMLMVNLIEFADKRLDTRKRFKLPDIVIAINYG